MIPQQLQALLLQQAGGAQGPPAGPPEQAEGEGDWLVNAINSVHSGMVQEADPKHEDGGEG